MSIFNMTLFLFFSFSSFGKDLINLMLKDFLGLFDIEFPVISLTNFHTLATSVTGSY